MRRPRRIARWLVAVVFLAMVAWWLVYVPRPVGGPYRALPAEATIVAGHQDLLARWPSFSANPAGASLLHSIGIEPDVLEQALDHPALRILLNGLVPDDLAWAYLPSDPFTGEPAWVFAGWIGGRSQLLRWAYTFMPPPGFVARRLPGGERYWEIESERLPAGLTLAVTFVEGMLVGTMAPSPTAIMLPIEAQHGRRPSCAADVERWLRGGCGPVEGADRGWARFPPHSRRTWWPPPRIFFNFDRMDAAYLSGRVCVPSPLPGVVAEPSDAFDVAPSGPLAQAGRPLLLLSAEAGALTAILGETAGPVWAHACNLLASGAGTNPVMLALLGDDYSGRLFEVKVPALMAATRVADEAEAERRMRAVADLLNGAYRWGLVPRPMPTSYGVFYVLERTALDSGDSGKHVPPIAFAYVRNWLIVSTSTNGLEELVDEVVRGRAANQFRDTGAGMTGARAYGWLDLARSATSFRAAIKLYAFKLLLDEPSASQALRERLNHLLAWIDALEPMAVCQVWLDADATSTSLRVRLGR